MNLKRMCIGVCAVLAVAVVTSCSSSSGTSANGNGAVTITLLSSATVKNAITAEASKFEAANPNVKIKISVVPDAAMATTLPQELAAGNAADVFTSWPGIYSTQAAGVLGEKGYAMDLSNEPWAKTLPARLKNLAGANGKIYYTPLVSLPILAMYNQTALDKYGLKVPTTWNQVIDLCQTASQKGVIPFAFGAQTASQNQMPAMALAPTVVDRVDPNFTADREAGKTTFAASAWVDVFSDIQQMNKSGCFKSPLGTNVSTAQSQLASGQALGMFGPSSYFSILQGMAGSSNSITAAAFPGTNNASDTMLAVGLGSGFSVNAKTKHPAAAKQFVDFLMEQANANAYAIATSQVPAIPNSAFHAPDQATSLSLQFIADNKIATIGNQLYPNPKVVPAWQSANEQMLGGNGSPLDVAKAMDSAWESQ